MNLINFFLLNMPDIFYKNGLTISCT